jgi:translocation and assembly module TamA
MFSRVFLVALVLACVDVGAAERVRVKFEGVEEQLLENVKQLVTLEQQKGSDVLTDERINKLHRKASSEIREALQPFGYYRVGIESELVFDDGVWNARYVIDPGPRLRVTELDLQARGAAEGDAAFARLIRNFPLKVGAPLLHSAYEEGKDSFMQLATERGYFDAQYEVSEIRVDLEAYTATIVIHFQTGSRFHFGDLTFNAPEFSDEFLARFATFKAGDPYSFGKMLDLQNALTDSDYFSQVEVKSGRDEKDPQRVPVIVDAQPRDRTKYTMGLGYGTDTGARATAGVERRRVNKYGHRWRADLKLSEIGNSLTTRYIIPMRNPSTDQFAVTAGRDDQRLDESTSTKYLLTGSFTRLDNGWQKTLFLNYERDEQFEVGTQTGSSTLVMPGINWTRIRADDRIYTTHGQRFMIEVRGGSETLGSTTSFLQARINAKFVRRLFSWGRVLARADLGYTEVLNFEELPPSVRFFAGGDFSVRGYDYNSLGPREDDQVIGGTRLAVGGIEYEQLLGESWSAAVFYDVGNAVDDFSEPLARAFGAGIRYRSPIGLIRVDLARPLDDMGDARYLHISIGPDL